MEIILTSHKIAMSIEQVGAWHREGTAHHTWMKIASDMCRGCSDNLLSPLNGREQPSVLTQLHPSMNSHFSPWIPWTLTFRGGFVPIGVICRKLAQANWHKTRQVWPEGMPSPQGVTFVFVTVLLLWRDTNDQHLTGSFFLTVSEG